MSEYRSSYTGSHALIVGINIYADPRFMPLGNAESDAQAMADLLSSAPYHFEVNTLLGSNATKSAVLQALYQLRRSPADDRILVYFAGHGYVLTDRLGNETGFLACADTTPEQDFTALKLNDVTDLTLHTEAKHVGFIFDACFSGQALGLTRAPAVTADKLMQRRAYQVISAGAGDQTVSDYQSMTWRLIEALRSDILLNDGLVTFGELGLHVQQVITGDSRQTQIPQFGHIRGSQGGDFVFYVDTSVRLPAELEDVLRSNRATVRLSGVVELIDIANSDEVELAQVARDRLTSIAQNDPDQRVREAAESYFVELDAQHAEEEARRRREQARQARDITPVYQRKPRIDEPPAAPEPELEPPPTPTKPLIPEYQTVPDLLPRLNLQQPPVEPVVETPPAAAPAPVIAVSKRVEVNVPPSKAAPAPVFNGEMVDAKRKRKGSLPVPLFALVGVGLLAVVAAAVMMLNLIPSKSQGSGNDNNAGATQASSNMSGPLLGPNPSAVMLDDSALPSGMKVQLTKTYSNQDIANLDENPTEFLSKLEEWGRLTGYAKDYVVVTGCDLPGYREISLNTEVYETSEGAAQAEAYYQQEDQKEFTIYNSADVGDSGNIMFMDDSGDCTISPLRLAELHFVRYNVAVQVALYSTQDSYTDELLESAVVRWAKLIDQKIQDKAQ